MKRVLLLLARDGVFDSFVVSAALVISAVDTLSTRASLQSHGGVTFGVLAVVALSLVFRRRAPLLVGWIVTATAAAMVTMEAVAPGSLFREHVSTESGLLPVAAVPFAAYGAMAFAKDRRAATVLVGTLTALAAVTAYLGDGSRPEIFVLGMGLVAVPALLGMYAAARRQLLQAWVERAERAEREQHLLAEQARADERARLASEMHDVVTHRVSLMVLRAGALRVTARDEATRAAAEDVRATGCQAMAELSDLVRLLRDPSRGDHGPPVVPARVPIPDFASLVEESRSVGVTVDLVAEGSPAVVSPGVARTAYRIVQEALTNVRKHAPGAAARIQLHWYPDRVHLTIHNGQPAGAVDAALVSAGSGTGLAGLRQRVELIGGTLSAGPEHDGGFRVHATLPTSVSRQAA